jgi:hypothetical protein
MRRGIGGGWMMSEEETKRAKVGPTTSNEGFKDSQGKASESSMVRCKVSRQLHRARGCRVPNGSPTAICGPAPMLGLAIFKKANS